jgi:hypothetical protein
MSKLSAKHQEIVRARLAAQKALARANQLDTNDSRLKRIDGHEKFWIKAIVVAVRNSQKVGPDGIAPEWRRPTPELLGLTQKELTLLLATDAQKFGRTFSESLMRVAFFICGLGYLKESEG